MSFKPPNSSMPNDPDPKLPCLIIWSYSWKCKYTEHIENILQVCPTYFTRRFLLIVKNAIERVKPVVIDNPNVNVKQDNLQIV